MTDIVSNQQDGLPLPGAECDKCATNMRALTLIYHEEFEPAILGIIQRRMAVARYTRINQITGARMDMLKDVDYQPQGQNGMLVLVAERQVVQLLVEDLRALRKSKGHGLRGYVSPVEEVI